VRPIGSKSAKRLVATVGVTNFFWSEDRWIGDLRLREAETAFVEIEPLSDEEDGLLPTRRFSAVYVDAGKNQVRLERR
jgi:hypothetical protein